MNGAWYPADRPDIDRLRRASAVVVARELVTIADGVAVIDTPQYSPSSRHARLSRLPLAPPLRELVDTVQGVARRSYPIQQDKIKLVSKRSISVQISTDFVTNPSARLAEC